MSWVEEELETIDLGDKRLNNRLIHIVETLGLAPGRTIPQSFKSWAEIVDVHLLPSSGGEKIRSPSLLILKVVKFVHRNTQ